MPRRFTLVQQVRGLGHPVLLVDGGDGFFSTPTKKAPTRAEEERALRTARTILQAYQQMGYDVLGLGPADLQLGVEILRVLLRDATFPVVCANLVHADSGKPVFQESLVLERGGVRYGFYGVVLSTVNPAFKRRVLGGSYRLLDAVETTRRVVPELRERCDVLIGLSHVNIDDNEEIARTVPGIDVIVDPYSRYGNQAVFITEGEYVVVKNEVPIVRIDGQGSRVGVFEMDLPQPAAASGPRRFSRYQVHDHPLEPQIFGHPEMVNLLATLERGKKYEPPAGFQPRELYLLGDDFLGSFGENGCGACHERQFTFWKGTKHQSAFASLEGNPGDHLRPECVECHTVAYGVTYAHPARVDRFKGVQCESCHGFNPQHPEDPRRYRLGKVNDETCWGCHNPEVTQRPFDANEALKKTACPRMEE